MTIKSKGRTSKPRRRTQQRQAGVGSSLSRAASPSANSRLPLLRTSERGTFKRCRWLWSQEFLESLKSQDHLSPRALRFGSLIHKALADYYIPGKERGPDPAERFAHYYDEQVQKTLDEFEIFLPDEEVWADARVLGIEMLENYVGTYGTDGQYEVIMSEQPFQQVVPHPDTGEPWFVYVGIMDGVWRDLISKKLFIIDHKTAASIQTKYLSLDDQAAAYWTFGQDWIRQQGILPEGEKLQGMVFNFLRKQRPDQRRRNEDGHYLNNDGSVSKKQPAPYFQRQHVYREEAARLNLRARAFAEFQEMQMIKDGKLAVYKNPGQFTCPGCWAFDFCELHEAGHDWEELRDAVAREWDAYAEHETYIAETR